jgi:hypothetical protein
MQLITFAGNLARKGFALDRYLVSDENFKYIFYLSKEI